MKGIKKTAVIALTLGLFISSAPYAALADSSAITSTTLTQTQAVEIAKKYVPLDDSYKMRSATFVDGNQGKFPNGRSSYWVISFSKDSRTEGGSVSFVIDAKTGALTNFDMWTNDDSSLENSISRDEARGKAIEYLKRFAPELISQVQELVSSSPYTTNDPSQVFRFTRMVKGIPFSMDGITIRLNGKGEIRSFSLNWSDQIQFPSEKPAITIEQAKELYKKSMRVQLFYQRVTYPYPVNPIEAQLVYGIWAQDPYNGAISTIDANNGNLIGRDGNLLPEQKPFAFTPLTESAGSPVTTKELTKEEAINLITKFNFNFDGYKLENVSYTNYTEQEPVWRFEYRQGDPKDYKTLKTAVISIDAKTGEIREFYRSAYQEGPYEFPANPTVTEEQARQKAIEFIKMAMPAKTNQIALNPFADSRSSFKMGPFYSFEFLRLVDGIPFRDSSFRVGVDPTTGEIREYWNFNSWSDNIIFPGKDNLLGAETAVSKYLEEYPLQLQYAPIYEQGKNPYEPGKITKVALVYAPLLNNRPIQSLNAVTGEWISAWGATPTQPREIEDLKGHWAEKQIRYFLDRGVFAVENGKIKPDAPVTRSDMIKYLVMIVDGPRTMADKTTFEDVPNTDPNFKYIEEAVARKWINNSVKNFRPTDVMTREELADAVSAILGYSKLSDTPNTFVNHFKDVEETGNQYQGDISIMGALGIMTGSDGMFRPKQQVTKAQAAVVMSRLLDQLREKQNYPYYTK